jgi:high affinity sulfate transporter 1
MNNGTGARDRMWLRLPLFEGIRPLNRSLIPKDLIAGFTLAAMNIPQALGYARIAGMPVVTGLYTLLLPLVAFATLGSSRYLVVAADSATAAILAGGLAGMAPVASAKYGALAATVALLTGAWLVLARLLRLGFLAEFLSQTVLVGFLTGVGIQVGIAVSGQMLGLEIQSRGTVGQIVETIRNLPQVHLPAPGISLAAVAFILACRYFAPRTPGPLIAVLAAISASYAFDFAGRGIVVIGPVLAGLPRLGLAEVSWREVWSLTPVAGACAAMVVAQSAATSRAYAARHHQQFDENRDIAGLAAANFAAGLSGTFVVNGSPTQTAMVERSGGRSQLTHLSTAAVVALVLLFFTGPLQFLPRCVLGSIVFTIAIGLIDLHSLRAIRRESPGEYALAVITAFMVVTVGVEAGILAAMVLSLLRIVQHSYHPHTAVLVVGEKGEWRLTPVAPGALTEPGLVVYRFGAPLFYFNADRFSAEIRELVAPTPAPVRFMLVDAGPVTHVDYTAARTLLALKHDLDLRGVLLAFAHVQSDLRADLDRHHLTSVVGEALLFDTLHEALATLRRKALTQ